MHKIHLHTCCLLDRRPIREECGYLAPGETKGVPLKARLIVGTRSLHSRGLSRFAKDPLSFGVKGINIRACGKEDYRNIGPGIP